MNWTCPICSGVFEKRNVPHRCEPIDLETLMRGDKKRLALLQRLLKALNNFGALKTSTTTRALTLSARNGFCIVYPRKESLELGFFLHREHADLPVYKTECFTGKFVHWTRIYDRKDIDRSLIKLLKEAYAAAS